MKYNNIVEGRFESRPNRFIAYVTMNGQREKVHVKNTGRCRELLTEQATVYLEKSDNAERSTAYDLVAVRKGKRLVNMDSQAPNKAVGEWLLTGELFPDVTEVKPEKTYGNSRFDFYVEAGERKIFMEVKGVTLEKDDVVLFPDAPSERAVKHVYELIKAVEEGYEAYIMLVIQMKDVEYFVPNAEMHPEFAKALLDARRAGVKILAYDCEVTPTAMNIRKPVDYSEMYELLDKALAGMPAQMKLYTLIGQAVSTREEKGAAVAAAEYLQERYPDISGFSPRNLRRMREFYRTYSQSNNALELAMQIGWTQNVVILEAELSMQERVWYIRRVALYGWTKNTLLQMIQNEEHLSGYSADTVAELCAAETTEEQTLIDKEQPSNRQSIIPTHKDPHVLIAEGRCPLWTFYRDPASPERIYRPPKDKRSPLFVVAFEKRAFVNPSFSCL